VQISAQKTYRSLGVQTISREKRSQSIQVSVLVEPPPSQVASRRSSLSSRRSGSGSSPMQGRDAGRTSELLAKLGHSSAPRSIRSRSMNNDVSYGHSVPMEPVSRPQRDFVTPSLPQPSRPPAKFISTPRVPTSKAVSPPRVVPPTRISPPPSRPSIQTNRHAKAPSIARRQISNDSSVGSPPSSVGPVSPGDDQPFSAPIRTGTRVWDPARGVELFKRGSEEVLARFLKMGGSWDENTH
jgi:hypothetical protein